MTSHPIDIISEFCDEHSEIRQLEFGIYRYTPQSVADERRVVHISAPAIRRRVPQMSAALEQHQELAMHSRVKLLENDVRHLPMIDFVGDISEGHIDRVRSVAWDFGCRRVAVFRTGRSYHAYLLTLVPHEVWLRFLARLILLNLPSEVPWIDTRWVGHALMAGFSSLRWTHHTKSYLAMPRLACELDVEQDRVAIAENV